MIKRIVRWVGIVLGVLLGLIVVALVGAYIASEGILNKTYMAPTPVIRASTDAAVVQHGSHLANTISVCVSCHGTNLGGGVVVDDPALGRLIAPNLTRGPNGVGNRFSDADYARAIRYGVLPDGKSVRAMPSNDYNHLGDADLTAIISYVRSVPAVDNNLPGSEMRLLARLLIATGQLPIMTADRIDTNAAPPPAPPAGVTVEYGKYLADNAGCTGCHGPGLSGGKVPGTPPDYFPPANITPGGEVGAWSEANFVQTLRTGANPGGHKLNEEMPWQYYQKMTDDELRALWQFVKSVPPKPYGNR